MAWSPRENEQKKILEREFEEFESVKATFEKDFGRDKVLFHKLAKYIHDYLKALYAIEKLKPGFDFEKLSGNERTEYHWLFVQVHNRAKDINEILSLLLRDVAQESEEVRKLIEKYPRTDAYKV